MIEYSQQYFGIERYSLSWIGIFFSNGFFFNRKIEEPTAKRIKSEGSELSANHPRNDAGQLVYSKFDFIVKDDQQVSASRY